MRLITRLPRYYPGIFICLAIWVSAARCPAQTPPGLDLQLVGGQIRLTVTGEISSPLKVQYAADLDQGGWVTISNFTSASSSTLVIELIDSSSTQRWYRAVIEVPANMAWVSAGSFAMGSPTNEIGRGPNDETRHNVTLTKGKFVGKFQVTQAEYLSLINTNPAWFNTNHGFSQDLLKPVEQVTWADATNFCGKLTERERSAGRIFTNWTYRLPTEAEWEHACRAGNTNAFYAGPNFTNSMGNFNARYGYIGGTGTVFDTNGAFLNRPTTAGGYAPNAWGIYDIGGNVWEWCQDWYTNYPAGSISNPTGPASGTQRVFRGGAFNSVGEDCRSANRNKYDPTSGFNTLGFRVVLVPP